MIAPPRYLREHRFPFGQAEEEARDRRHDYVQLRLAEGGGGAGMEGRGRRVVVVRSGGRTACYLKAAVT